MSKSDTIEDSNIDYDKKKLDNVVYLFPNSQNSADKALNYETNLGTGSQQVTKIKYKKTFDEIRKKNDNEIINKAYNLIVDALDHKIDSIERSNFFDEWKDYLDIIIAEVTNLSVNHRKILGAIVVATKDKDIADLTTEELRIMKEATYMLRQMRVTKSDSKRIIKRLIDIDINITIPLATDGISDKDAEKLDELMRTLIKKSKEA